MPDRPAGRRRLVHRACFVRSASATAAGYLRLMARTSRWDCDFHPETVALCRERRGSIVVFWHQRLLLVPHAWARLKAAAGAEGLEAAAIVSRHGDGELIARTLELLGIATIRGSTRKGGAAAAREARRLLDRGGCVGVVTDGPRGPHGHVHGGAAFLAKITGRPMYPLTFAVDRGVQARSWDRMLIPLPFARGALLVGPPLDVPAESNAADLEALGRELRRRLHALNLEADGLVGASRHGAALPLDAG